MCKRHDWTENWKGQLYCQKCGILREELKTRYAHTVNRPPAPVDPEAEQRAIIAEIKAHPLYGYAWRLAELIASDYGIDLHITFSNSRGSHLEQAPNGRFTVSFGYECIDIFSDRGFRDLKTLHHHIWGQYPELTGKNAVWALVLHELAHNVQYDGQGHRRYNEQHPTYWADEVKALQQLYPPPAA